MGLKRKKEMDTLSGIGEPGRMQENGPDLGRVTQTLNQFPEVPLFGGFCFVLTV